MSAIPFDGEDNVAATTGLELSRILCLRRELGQWLYAWPIDGCSILAGKSAVTASVDALTAGQKDALLIPSWFKAAYTSRALGGTRPQGEY